VAIDASKVKRRLPPPPAPEEGAPGIERQPEPAPDLAPTAAAPAPAPPILDGRRMRATGRIMQLNIKVTADTKVTILRLAKERQQLVAEVIEDAIATLAKGGR
jgi:hypothetical protein